MRADLETDAQDLGDESWSQVVDQTFVKKHSKEMVKRQDVIYGQLLSGRLTGFKAGLYICC